MSGMLSRVVAVSAAEARPLRQQVLRPNQPIAAVTNPRDEDVATLHAGIRINGVLVGVATVIPESLADLGFASGAAWRLRGMAVSKTQRGRGIGAVLVQACIDHVRQASGALIWCNARVNALGFYERLGFQRNGRMFYVEGTGDHFLMHRELGK